MFWISPSLRYTGFGVVWVWSEFIWNHGLTNNGLPKKGFRRNTRLFLRKRRTRTDRAPKKEHGFCLPSDPSNCLVQKRNRKKKGKQHQNNKERKIRPISTDDSKGWRGESLISPCAFAISFATIASVSHAASTSGTSARDTTVMTSAFANTPALAGLNSLCSFREKGGAVLARLYGRHLAATGLSASVWGCVLLFEICTVVLCILHDEDRPGRKRSVTQPNQQGLEIPSAETAARFGSEFLSLHYITRWIFHSHPTPTPPQKKKK